MALRVRAAKSKRVWAGRAGDSALRAGEQQRLLSLSLAWRAQCHVPLFARRYMRCESTAKEVAQSTPRAHGAEGSGGGGGGPALPNGAMPDTDRLATSWSALALAPSNVILPP